MTPAEDVTSRLAAALRQLSQTRRDLDRLEHDVVELVRACGATWEQIGEELGVSRQYAARRYGTERRRQRD